MIDSSTQAEIISLFCRLNINSKKNVPIRSSEMGYLIYVSKTKPAPTPNQISSFFYISRPMVTSLTKSLLKQGYIKKEESLTDKRSFQIILTKKGETLVNDTIDDYHHSLTLLENELGKENYLNLINLLNRANSILLEEKRNE